MENSKYFLIVNLIAGQGRCKEIFPSIKKELDRSGIEYDLHYTNEPEEATDVARMGIESGFTHIVAVGGDGTVNEVTNGVVGTDAILAVIPAGTGNDFIRMTGIPSDYRQAVRLLAHGRERSIDLGRIDDQRYFVNGLGIGIDAQVAQDVLKMERMRGAVAYLYAAVKEVFKFKAFSVRLEKVVDALEQGTKLKDVLFDHLIAELACGAAIKAGDRLSLNEQQELIDRLLTMENPYTCPHGRPIIFSISRHDLDLRFKRA